MRRNLGAILLLAGLLTGGSEIPAWANYGGSGAAMRGGVAISGLTPGDLSGDVAPNSPVTVEFAGSIGPSFYQSINLALLQGTRSIDGEMFYNQASRQVMFKPRASLSTGQTYTVQLSWADGSGGTSEKAWSFRVRGGASGVSTTSDKAAVTAPATNLVAGIGAAAGAAVVSGQSLTIVNANMAQGAVSPNTPLEITFSEPLDLSSLRESPIKLLAGKEMVGIDYRLSRDMKTLSLVPRSGLRTGAEYRIALAQGLASTSGSRLSKNTLIPFSVSGSEAASKGGVEVPSNVLEEAPAAPARNSGARIANPFEQNDSGSADAAFNYGNPAPRRSAAYGSGGQDRAGLMPVVAQAPAAAAAPLKIIAMSPRNGDAVSNLSQAVTLAFSGDLRPETLNEFTFRLEDDFGPVPARIRYVPERRQAVLTPVGVLDLQHTYRVVLTKGVTDMSGRAISNALTSSFSTRSPISSPAIPEYAAAPSDDASSNEVVRPSGRAVAAPRRVIPQTRYPAPDPRRESHELNVIDDETSAMQEQGAYPAEVEAAVSESRSAAPVRSVPRHRENLSTFKVTGITPAAGADNVGRGTKIMIQFNEDVHPSTVNSINISIFGDQKRIEGRVSYDAGRRRAIFTPAEPLDAETLYKVRLSDKIKSRNGEPLLARYSWEFTTSSERRPMYHPRATGSAEADAAFSIPLVDRKNAGQSHGLNGAGNSNGNKFGYLSSKHWSFKSVQKIAQKGILPNYPFGTESRVSRYEMAMVVNSALNNLKSLQKMQNKPNLRIGDLVELEQLVVSFNAELRSYGTDPSWLEHFLQEQGVQLDEIKRKVADLDRTQAG
ncbi:MAG: Ig-like domain-containing protein [Candidatus Riflebacteria bacterium]|nr:Ig-like domain-containing protein [Candidatus Riflebacteria bacterium]